MKQSSASPGAPLTDAASAARTLYQKLWDSHTVRIESDGTALLYIDRQLIHEVSSPQAFDALTLGGRAVRRPASHMAVADHNVPTRNRSQGIADPISRRQVDALTAHTTQTGISLVPLADIRQGIVHVIGPEQGMTLPGMTIVCGDSHTSTHGAFGALAFGIGTSEVEHVLATQCLSTRRMRTLRIFCDGLLADGVSAKDLALCVIGAIGTAGGVGHAIEYAGTAIAALTMEGRMTLCNMSIEAGARTGMIAVDERTIEYVRGRPGAPSGEDWDKAVSFWRTLRSDAEAIFDRELRIDASAVRPQVTWGTAPDLVVAVDGEVPDPACEANLDRRRLMVRALDYMGLRPGQRIAELEVDKVFIGSCTNGRIEDLRSAAAIVRGKHKSARVAQAIVVPGSGLVKAQAEQEGLDRVFIDAGLEWRDPGCSMCLAMNGDELAPGERCASTSNRNFEGRQGASGRTHLVSPAMAAAAAITGHFTDVRGWHR